MQWKIRVTCAAGTESEVKKELRALGFVDPKAVDGGIRLSGSDLDVARLNLFLSCADRVYIEICSFPAKTFDELFDGLRAFDFPGILPFNAKILVNGKSKKSALFALSACQSVVKKAIVTTLSERYGRKVLPESGETYRFEFLLENDVFTLFLNTSGEGLHKRGWRTKVWETPMRETLAATVLSLSDVSGERPFLDPFCGSGTLAIEGARKVLGIAPGRDRGFDFTKWDFFDEKAYRLASEEARDREKRDREIRFFASDINKKAVELARFHAKNAGVGDKIVFSVRDARKLNDGFGDGCIVTNPPYGERLTTDRNALYALYKAFGAAVGAQKDRSLYLITAFDGAEKALGRKADKKRKLFNAGIECTLYSYLRPRDGE